jgi:diguanylate cyclase
LKSFSCPQYQVGASLCAYGHELHKKPSVSQVATISLPDVHSRQLYFVSNYVISGDSSRVKQNLLGKNGIAVAHLALKAISDRAITPTPENYAVWLCYFLKEKSDLNVKIDALIKDGGVIDDRMCDDLYTAFFEEQSFGTRIMSAGGKIAAEMADVVRGLKDVSQHTKAYGEKLQVAQTQLSKKPDHATTSGVVANLVGATNEMESKTRAIEERLVESSKEIAALREKLEAVKVEASTDALTGVANRKEFETRFAELAAKADAGGGPLSLVMCDIDFFKRVNDTFGHQTGDQVIRFVATTMDRAKPENGLVARIGGEEFAMLAPNTDRKAAMILAEKIRVAVEGKRLVRRSTNIDLGKITVSLGVAQRALNEKSASQIERADNALYESKRTGRNKVTLEAMRVAKAA